MFIPLPIVLILMLMAVYVMRTLFRRFLRYRCKRDTLLVTGEGCIYLHLEAVPDDISCGFVEHLNDDGQPSCAPSDDDKVTVEVVPDDSGIASWLFKVCWKVSSEQEIEYTICRYFF